jgi:hypothetical protein
MADDWYTYNDYPVDYTGWDNSIYGGYDYNMYDPYSPYYMGGQTGADTSYLGYNSPPSEPTTTPRTPTSGGGSNWLSSLLGTGLAGLSSLLQNKAKSASTGGTMTVNAGVDQGLRSGTATGMAGLLSNILGLQSGSGWTPEASQSLKNYQSYKSATRPGLEAAGRTLLDYINNPAQLSKYSLEAAELADKLAKDNESMRDEVQRQLDQLGYGYSQRGYRDAESIISDAITKYQTAAMGIKQGLGKQEEALRQAREDKTSSFLQQYSQTFGPEEAAKEVIMSNLESTTKLKYLKDLSAAGTDVAKVLNDLAKTGVTTTVTAPNQASVGLNTISDILKSALAGLYPNLGATTSTSGATSTNPFASLLQQIFTV